MVVYLKKERRSRDDINVCGHDIDIRPNIAAVIIIIYYFLWLCSPARTMTSSFTRFRYHTQSRTTVGRTPLPENTQHTHKRQTCMPPMRVEPTIAAGERS
jgi:hypothetical protein